MARVLGATKIGCILKPRERTRTETFQDRAREAKPASLLPPRVDACVQTEQRSHSDAPPVTSPVLDLGSSTPPRDQVQNAEGESEHSEAASEAERRREQEAEMQRQARHSFSLSAAQTAPSTLQPGSYLEEQEGGGQEGVDGATKVERGGVARMVWASIIIFDCISHVCRQGSHRSRQWFKQISPNHKISTLTEHYKMHIFK